MLKKQLSMGGSIVSDMALSNWTEKGVRGWALKQTEKVVIGCALELDVRGSESGPAKSSSMVQPDRERHNDCSRRSLTGRRRP